ncbi:hypothetical protein M3Y97_00616800 [Aphelenchoides bicaudatus]|nr:hypothetical protein M3Y97_00616800 [Aphelenchoides bicaudatus]
MLSEFYMLFSVLGIILAFCFLGVLIWILEARKKRRFTEKAILFHNVSRDNAETLYKLQNDRKIATTNEVYTRGLKLNGSRVESLQRENYYCLIRWVKKLRAVKNDEDLRFVALQVVKEMERRAKSYGLDPLEQAKLWELTELPEDILLHYEPDT